MSEASLPPPLALTHAWIMDALVDSPETDAVALAELLIQNAGFWSRPSATRERVAIRFLEEYLASWSSDDGSAPPVSPLPAGETSRMPALNKPDVCQFDLNQSSEDVLQCFLRKLRVLGSSRTYEDTAFINAIRQFTKQKRSALPKCFLEQLKDRKCSEKTSPTKIIEAKSILSEGNDGSGRVCQASKNHENKASAENMEKVTESAAKDSTAGLNMKLAGNDADAVTEHVEISTSPSPTEHVDISTSPSPTEHVEISTSPPPVNRIIPEQNGVETRMQPLPGEIPPDSDHEIVQETTSGEYEQPFDVVMENKIIASEKCKFIAIQNGINPDLMTESVTQATQQDLCIKCDEGGQLLICSVNSCPIAVHEKCLGSTATFLDTGDFVCPFCSYSRATTAYYDARKKFSIAKKVLSSFMGWGPSLKREASKPSISAQPSDLNKTVKDKIVMEKASGTNEPTKDGKRAKGSFDGCRNGMPTREGFFGDSRKEGDSPDGAVKPKANRTIEPTKEGNCANSCVDGGIKHIPTREGFSVDSKNGGSFPDGAANHEPKQTGSCSRAFISGRTLRSAPRQSNENFANDNQQATSSPYLSFSEHDSQEDPGRTSDVAKSPQNKGDTEHVKETSNDKKRRKKELVAKNAKQQKKDLAGDHVDEIKTSSEFQAETSNNCQYVSATEKTCSTSSEVNSGKRKTTAAGLQIHNQVKDSPSRKERKHKRTNASSSHFAKSRIQLPLGRRNRLPWTEEEEEILKEAMQNVTHCGRYGGIPWADILEYGRHVFHKTRQPADLRVKWRNIQKKESEML